MSGHVFLSSESGLLCCQRGDQVSFAPLSDGMLEFNVKKWQCIVCGLIYDEAEGWPDDGIEPGTVWEDVPEDWMCPECGVGKEDFEMVEID